MMFRKIARIAALLAGTAAGTQAQTGELNLLTDLGHAFPARLSFDRPARAAAVPDSLLVDKHDGADHQQQFARRLGSRANLARGL